MWADVRHLQDAPYRICGCVALSLTLSNAHKTVAQDLRNACKAPPRCGHAKKLQEMHISRATFPELSP